VSAAWTVTLPLPVLGIVGLTVKLGESTLPGVVVLRP
jgi:hypothetical protein